jgi:hypothetical protein
MYNGRTKFFGKVRRIVVNRRSGIAGLGLIVDPAAEKLRREMEALLTEVPVNVYGRYAPNSPYPPTESDIPEIVVSGTRIPWWMWGIGGALAFAALNKFSKR